MKTLLALLLFGGLAAVARAGADEPAPADHRPATLWRGSTYRGDGAEAFALRIWNAEQWRAFCAETVRGEPPPAPDFAHGTVLVVDGGACPTGGWQVDVVRAYREQGEWILEYRRVPPAPDRFVTQAVTHPLAVVIFAKADLGREQVMRDVTPRDTRGRPVR